MKYFPNGNNVEFGDVGVVATTGCMVAAMTAADLLNRARVVNDVQRKYTAAARLIARAECVDGFEWTDISLAA